MGTPTRLAVHASALLAGIGGLGAQCVLLAQAGFVAGQSSAAAFGPGSFVVGWAGAAWWAGRTRRSTRAVFWALAALNPFLLGGVGWMFHRLATAGANVAPLLAFVLLALAGLGQGAFLPLLARERNDESARVGSLFAVNLLGCVIGAYGLGFEAIARWGRPSALALALGASCAAAVIAALAARAPSAVRPSREGVVPRDMAIFAVLVTSWTLALEWLCLRLAVLWVGGQASQLSTILACSMVALAAGAALLPRLLPTDQRGVVVLLALASLATVWPVWATSALRWSVERGDVWVCAMLVVPAMLPLGAALPLLHAMSRGESGRRLGDLLRFEILGAAIVGPLLHFVAVPYLGIGGTLGLLAGVGGVACCALFSKVRGSALAAAVVCGVAALVTWRAPEPALASPKWSDPSLRLLAFREDRHFAVAVVDDGLNGERTLLTDQFRAAGTGRDYRYMRVLGHLPLLLHPAPRHVAVLALGTGTTLGSVAAHGDVERIDVLEISSAVVALAPWFVEVNRGALSGSDPRIRVLVDDGRRTLASREGEYDVITMEPLLPDSPFGVYLYTPEFYAVARRALAPGGVMCQWVPPHALEPEVFDAVLEAFAAGFPSAQAWLFGTQLILIGRADDVPLAAPDFGALTADLGAQLGELGLGDLAGVRARFIGDLRGFATARRKFNDLDPWIAWRRKPTDARILTWLPRNLERLTNLESSPSWSASVADTERAHTLRNLREARIAAAWAEVEIRKGTLDAASVRERALSALEGLPSAQRAEPEIAAFVEDVEFMFSLRSGVSALASGANREAFPHLLRAAELRRERADVHAYLSIALQRAQQSGSARAALAKALELCPRLFETNVGARLVALGWVQDSQQVENAAAVER